MQMLCKINFLELLKRYFRERRNDLLERLLQRVEDGMAVGSRGGVGGSGNGGEGDGDNGLFG